MRSAVYVHMTRTDNVLNRTPSSGYHSGLLHTLSNESSALFLTGNALSLTRLFPNHSLFTTLSSPVYTKTSYKKPPNTHPQNGETIGICTWTSAPLLQAAPYHTHSPRNNNLPHSTPGFHTPAHSSSASARNPSPDSTHTRSRSQNTLPGQRSKRTASTETTSPLQGSSHPSTRRS